MKKFDIEKGRAIIYISHPDLETLVKVKEYVSPDLFQEDSILKDECDEEGYYKIVKITNVNYIKSLSFIPHYNYLLKFGSTELEEMLDDELQRLDDIERVIATPCDQYTPLSDEEKVFLRSLNEVDKSLIELLISKDPRDENEWMDICDMAACIRAEYKNYARCVEEMMEYKQKLEGRTNGPNPNRSRRPKQKKCFSLKKLFEFICK